MTEKEDAFVNAVRALDEYPNIARVAETFMDLCEIEYSFPGRRVTIAHVTTPMGFEFTGRAATRNPEIFEPEVGKKFALEDAMDDLVQYLVFCDDHKVLHECMWRIVGQNADEQGADGPGADE